MLAICHALKSSTLLLIQKVHSKGGEAAVLAQSVDDKPVEAVKVCVNDFGTCNCTLVGLCLSEQCFIFPSITDLGFS